MPSCLAGLQPLRPSERLVLQWTIVPVGPVASSPLLVPAAAGRGCGACGAIADQRHRCRGAAGGPGQAGGAPVSGARPVGVLTGDRTRTGQLLIGAAGAAAPGRPRLASKSDDGSLSSIFATLGPFHDEVVHDLFIADYVQLQALE